MDNLRILNRIVNSTPFKNIHKLEFSGSIAIALRWGAPKQMYFVCTIRPADDFGFNNRFHVARVCRPLPQIGIDEHVRNLQTKACTHLILERLVSNNF